MRGDLVIEPSGSAARPAPARRSPQGRSVAVPVARATDSRPVVADPAGTTSRPSSSSAAPLQLDGRWQRSAASAAAAAAAAASANGASNAKSGLVPAHADEPAPTPPCSGSRGGGPAAAATVATAAAAAPPPSCGVAGDSATGNATASACEEAAGRRRAGTSSHTGGGDVALDSNDEGALEEGLAQLALRNQELETAVFSTLRSEPELRPSHYSGGILVLPIQVETWRPLTADASGDLSCGGRDRRHECGVSTWVAITTGLDEDAEAGARARAKAEGPASRAAFKEAHSGARRRVSGAAAGCSPRCDGDGDEDTGGAGCTSPFSDDGEGDGKEGPGSPGLLTLMRTAPPACAPTPLLGGTAAAARAAVAEPSPPSLPERLTSAATGAASPVALRVAASSGAAADTTGSRQQAAVICEPEAAQARSAADGDDEPGVGYREQNNSDVSQTEAAGTQHAVRSGAVGRGSAPGAEAVAAAAARCEAAGGPTSSACCFVSTAALSPYSSALVQLPFLEQELLPDGSVSLPLLSVADRCPSPVAPLPKELEGLTLLSMDSVLGTGAVRFRGLTATGQPVSVKITEIPYGLDPSYVQAVVQSACCSAPAAAADADISSLASLVIVAADDQGLSLTGAVEAVDATSVVEVAAAVPSSDANNDDISGAFATGAATVTLFRNDTAYGMAEWDERTDGARGVCSPAALAAATAAVAARAAELAGEDAEAFRDLAYEALQSAADVAYSLALSHPNIAQVRSWCCRVCLERCGDHTPTLPPHQAATFASGSCGRGGYGGGGGRDDSPNTVVATHTGGCGNDGACCGGNTVPAGKACCAAIKNNDSRVFRLRPATEADIRCDGSSAAADGAVTSPVCLVLVTDSDLGTLQAALSRNCFVRRAAACASASGAGAGAPLAADQEIDWEAVLLTLLDVAEGLRYLHSIGLVHRALQPASVLLRSSPPTPPPTSRDRRGFTAQLAEFGLAVPYAYGARGGAGRRGRDFMSATAAPGAPLGPVGPVHCIPPEGFERIGCPGAAPDPGFDIYAFGILMWSCVNPERSPFDEYDTRIVPTLVLHGVRPICGEHVPAAYRELSESCWSFDAAARPTAAQVASRLRSLLRGA